MASKTRTAGKASAKKQSGKTASKAESTAQTNGAKEAADQKRAAREVLETQQREYVAKNYVDGNENLSAVAKHLKVTSGKAAFLAMQIRVERGEVPKLTGKDDDALLKAINGARKKADEYSSWGWLAARSGRSESFIKAGLERLGLYKPKEENIASVRSASRPAPAKTGNKAENIAKSKSSGKKRVAGNA